MSVTAPARRPAPDRLAGPAPQRRTAPRSRPRLQIVAPTSAAPRRAPFVGVIVAVLGLGLLGLLALNTAIAEGAFRQADLERQLASLQDDEQALQQRVAVLAAPQRLAARAHEIGMVATVDPVFLRASDGAVLGKAHPAPAAPVVITPEPKAGTDERTNDPRGTAADPPARQTKSGPTNQQDQSGQQESSSGGQR